MAETSVQVKKAVPAQATAPDMWRSFRSEMDRVFDRLNRGFGFPEVRRMFDVEPFWRQESAFDFGAPAIDVTESDAAYTISAELPGISEKDVEVNITGDVLILSGEKRREREEKEKNRYLSERVYGGFQRALAIPDGVDRDGITAEFSKGVLTLTLPKSKDVQNQQKKIEIKAK
jgi:HSP20 family protein